MEKIYITWADLEKHCMNIARDIITSGWRPDYIVGISRGGAVPGIMLSHFLKVPFRPLEVSLRDGGVAVSDTSMAEDAVGYVPFDERVNLQDVTDITRRKNILIVDDINDSGATLEWIRNDWLRSSVPGNSHDDAWGLNVRVATIVHNHSSSEDVSYFGFEINKYEHDCWVVFPYENWWE